MTAATPSSQTADRLDTTGGFVLAIAALAAVGAVVGGIVLMNYSVPNCVVNPYDAALADCSSSTHPFFATGVSVLVAGLLQAFVISVVGRLCRVVAGLKADALGVQLASRQPYQPPTQTAFPYEPPGQ